MNAPPLFNVRKLLPALAVCALLSAGPAARAATGLAEVNGARLWYEEAGRGPAVVLLHGGLVDARLWDDQMRPLSRRYRAVRYDLRGYGKSSAPTESFSHVEDLRALLDFLKIDRATLVGLSLGGIVAADFALEHPERVERLVLVGPGLRGDMQPPDKAMEEVWKAIQDRDDGKVVAAYMGSPLYAAVRAGTTARARLERMLTDNLDGLETLRPGFIKYPEPATAERLGDVRAPTLVVIGDRDGRNLLNIADTLAAKIPGARKAVIRGASHHPPVETPKEFNRILLGFLREPLPAGK